MTIQYTDAKLIKELSHTGGLSNVRDLETLDLGSINRLERKLIIARFEDKVILTDIGMEVAEKLRAAL